MDAGGGERQRDREAGRGESTLGELAQLLVDNPWFNQALHVAFEARERASQAGASALRNLNVPTGGDVDRLARRMRSISERLEEVEDALDRLSREVAELRQERDRSRPGASTHAARPGTST